MPVAFVVVVLPYPPACPRAHASPPPMRLRLIRTMPLRLRVVRISVLFFDGVGSI